MDVEEDPTCRFVDYTNETEWERFVSALEETMLHWGLSEKGAVPQTDAPKAKLLPFHGRHYLLLLQHEDNNEQTPNWTDATRHFTPTLLSMAQSNCPSIKLGTMQRLFGVDTYLLLQQYHTAFGFPEVDDDINAISMDSTLEVMDHDAKNLLSALMVALGNCTCTLPAFVRMGGEKHFIGAAVPGMTGNVAIHFETNSAPEKPNSQRCLQGLMDFFQMKLQMQSIVEDSPVENSNNDLRLGISADVEYHYKWHAQAHQLLEDDIEEAKNQWRSSLDKLIQSKVQLDTLPWGPQDSPLKHISLTVRWPNLREGKFVDNVVHSTLDPILAPEWYLKCHWKDWEDNREMLPSTAALRQLVTSYQQLRQIGSGILVSEIAASGESVMVERYQESVPAARAAVAIGAAIGSWVSASNSTSLAALHDTVADLFTDLSKAEVENESWCELPNVQHGVVVGQLVSRLAVVMTNQQGINFKCAAWVEFVRILRETWQAKILLPWMGIGQDGMMNASDVDPLDGISMPNPDFRFNLLHQKLQMLNLCITRRVRSPMSRRQSGVQSDDVLDFVESDDEFFDTLEESPATGVLKPLDNVFRLDDNTKSINVPKTQDPTPLTEDLAKQQQDILAKLGVSAESTLLRQHIQSASMLSDMQAFKAANPQACLADFIRWYSPRDWISQTNEDYDNVSSFPEGQLSDRMHEPDSENPTNPWHRMWAQATPLAADKQRSLFDPVLEAEKIFDFLDTISPRDLFYHILVAMLSNLSVYWSSLDNIVAPCVLSAISKLQVACDKAVGALDDENLCANEVTEEEHHVLMAIADDALEKVLSSLQKVEMLLSVSASLSHLLPSISSSVLDALSTSTSSVYLESKEDQSIVAKSIWKDDCDVIHRHPLCREYTLRCVSHRPFFSMDENQSGLHPLVLSRLYVQVEDRHVRYALATVDTEF